MSKAFVLNEKDAGVLRAMIAEFARRPRNSEGKQSPELVSDLHQAPEVYVARVPSTGVPGLVWEAGAGVIDTPGTATCVLYRLMRAGNLSGRLVPLHISVTVHNLSTENVPADTWILVERDKFGTWWVSGSGGLTSEGDTGETGTGAERNYVDVVTGVCLISTSEVTTGTGLGTGGLGTGGGPI